MFEHLCRAGCIALVAMSFALSAAADPACLTHALEDPPVAEAVHACEAPGPWTSSLRLGTRGDSSRPSTLHPYRGLRAMAHPFRMLALWAQSQGFRLGRGSALYAVLGGATPALDHGVRFTASYRLSGFDLGFAGDVERFDVEPSIQATFVGLSFDF